VFQSATAKDAAELADAAAMFVVVRAKSNLEVLNGNLRKRPPASIHLREHLRQLGEVRRQPGLVLGERRKNGPNAALAGQGRPYLLSVLLTGFSNRRTCRGKVLRVHDRSQRNLCVEREKPRLSNCRNLR
jgi:hypothetical protein